MSDADKPVRWATPTNAWAVGGQMIALILPVLTVCGVYQPGALDELSPILSEVWQWMMLLSGLAGLAATLLMGFAVGAHDRMRAVLRLEAVATSILSACFLLLFASMVWRYGLLANPLTQTIVAALGMIAAGRVAQIVSELHRDTRASLVGKIIVTEALADAKDS